MENRLRRAGLRATRPRVLVFNLLENHGGHRSVDEIVHLLRQSGNHLPRMTVYNVVSDLLASGLIMRADAGPGRALYEAGGNWHHHFVCQRCESIIDIPCVVGEKPCLEAGAQAGTVEEAQVIFRGVCNVCKARGG
ncbi:MAG: transcriptional repressor [Gemmatimonadetes bacterium]|nr:transcriptional repressor [Gemmatimonadota bacterium]